MREQFSGDYQDENGELVDLIGDEPGQPGVVRVRYYFDGSEDVMPRSVFEWQFEYMPAEDDGDEWTEEDEARLQAKRAREAQQLREAHERADRNWLKRYGRQMPGCGCPDMSKEELRVAVEQLRAAS